MSEDLPSKSELNILKSLIKRFDSNPDILHHPDLKFFVDYATNFKLSPLKSTESKKPESNETKQSKPADAEAFTEHPTESTPDFDESTDEFKFDEPEIVKEALDFSTFTDELEVLSTPDVLNPAEHEHKDTSKEPSDTDLEQAQTEKAAGVEAKEAGNYELALKHFTASILLNPTSALLLANRAEIFLKLKKPNAAIEDCNLALKINPDSAKALKFRGKAYALLGKYAESHADLVLGQRIDYDDTTQQLLKKMQARIDYIHKAERDYVKKVSDRELREKKAKYEWAKRREERRKQKEEQETQFDDENFEDFPSGFNPYTAGAGAGAGSTPGSGPKFNPPNNMQMPPGVSDMLKDPDVMALLQDEGVMQGVQAAMQNPNYKDPNPAVQAKLEKLMKKFADTQKKSGGKF